MNGLNFIKLYYRYKKTSNEDIARLLQRIKLVVVSNKGIGTLYGYYPLKDEIIDKIIKKPRGVEINFQMEEIDDKPIENLIKWKDVDYLCKSSSRFLLKADVGEIIDQINLEDLYDSRLKAICFNSGYETLPDTEGEHHVMRATLLIEK